MTMLENLKVRGFIQAAPFDSRLLNTFFLRIGNEPEEVLYRIHPLLFAKKHNLDEKKVIDIFVLASCAGIFDLYFILVCPGCGLILVRDTSFQSLNKATHFCAVCHTDVPVVLDDTVEVVFQIHATIHKAAVNPFKTNESFYSHFFSRDFPGLSGKIVEGKDDVSFLSPVETKIFKLGVRPGILYRCAAINLNLDFLMYTGNKPGHNDPLQVTVNEMGFSQKKVYLNSGEIKVELKNECEQKIGILFIKNDLGKKNLSRMENREASTSFLSGKMLLNNTVFRNLFKIRNLPANLQLELRSLTFLFMELKSPADVQQRMGDTFVYELIQEHFHIMEEIADQYHGIIINTMGDVIMFSFPYPKNGFLAALSIYTSMKSVKYREKPVFSLKIGLHEGHALAINRYSQLDYFGRSVTIAAYLKDLAGPDEIFFSDTLLRDREIKKELVKQKDRLKLYKKNVKIKGSGKKMVIFKMVITHAGW